MSFDGRRWSCNICSVNVLIPFEQGDVFRQQSTKWFGEGAKVLIPFEQGDVFRRNALFIISMEKDVLIPFEQGDVFRP